MRGFIYITNIIYFLIKISEPDAVISSMPKGKHMTNAREYTLELNKGFCYDIDGVEHTQIIPAPDKKVGSLMMENFFIPERMSPHISQKKHKTALNLSIICEGFQNM